MGWALVAAEPHHHKGWIKRFDPRFWTVDFPRPMMASLVTPSPVSLRVEAVFYRKQDLAGLIWEAEDRWDHALLAYETRRDFRHCRLSFRWRSGGIKPLDALHGPTLTIEGRDAAGNPRAWYVRLWNYAAGTTSPSCRAMLGDRACRIDLMPLMHARRVVAAAGRSVTLDGMVGAMAFGELLWLEGPNTGLRSPVIGEDGAVLHLAEAPAFAIEGPVRVRLIEGCDKQLATCRERFGNAANFRGEAHLPGNDLLTRYPGG